MGLGLDVNTTAGSKLYMSANLPAADTLVGFTAVTSYTEITEITDMGEIAESFSQVNHASIDKRLTQTYKGTKDPVIVTIQVGRVKTDAGQVLINSYIGSDTNCTFKFVLKDGTTIYFAGLVLGANLGLGDANKITGNTITIAANTNIWKDLGDVYTITYVAGDNGSIVNESDKVQVIPSGGTGVYVVAIPDAGYEFTEWTEDSSTDPVRVETNVLASATYTATFTLL